MLEKERKKIDKEVILKERKSDKMNKYVKTFLFFIIGVGLSYLLINILTPEDFFKSPMYMLLPIVGFFIMFFLTKPIMEFISLKNKYIFASIFLIIGILSIYITFFFYYWNVTHLNNIPIKELFKFIFTNFELFKTSAFLPFLLSSVFGIFAAE